MMDRNEQLEPGAIVDAPTTGGTDVGMVLVVTGLVAVGIAVGLGFWTIIDLLTSPEGDNLRLTQYFSYVLGTPGPVALLGLLVASAGLLVRRLDFTDWSPGGRDGFSR